LMEKSGCRYEWRRECQSIPIDVKAVFHSSTWEPTVLATSHRCAPSLCAIFRRPGRGRRPGHLRLRRRRSEDAEGADRSQRLLEELRAAVLNGHPRGRLRRSASSRMPSEERPAVLASCSSKLAHR
jgi:hypothetical protein